MATVEIATEYVESIAFSFMTDEEVRKHSFVKITRRDLVDALGKPEPGGLYDPLLGPLGDLSICTACGQRSTICPGHCGHIDLVLPVYNPLLFNFLYKLLQRTCVFCHHFRADGEQVEKCVSKLELIVRGNVVGAKELDSISPSSPEESDISHESCSSGFSGVEAHDGEIMERQWTSVQFREAMFVLSNFLKLSSKKCKRCGKSNPNLTKPTFGWIHTNRLKDIDLRSNVIRSHKLRGTSVEDLEGMTDVEDISDAPHKGKATSKKHSRKMGLVANELIMQTGSSSGQLLPSEVKDIMKLLWVNEASLCSFITDIQQRGSGVIGPGPSMFFLKTILVPPIKFRPPARGGDSVMDHPQTKSLQKVLEANIALGSAHIKKEYSNIARRWMELQQSTNILFDSKTAKGPGQRDVASGICQLLEKKEGLFRQKMMGKRVNYACRSVISPDPYLGVNEIGIPPCFALKLTYPERVTSWNVVKLRSAVMNGPEIHPGAIHYADMGSVHKLPRSKKMRTSEARKLSTSRGAFMQTGTSADPGCEGKIVYRHLQDGDIVLVNRQPTLHKPSIMAHIVRVLKGEKTLRMHYANCSTYNADFDGDEINVHLPQDEISRAEAYNIVNANNQYVKPSNGEPIRSLIQDHIVSSTLLTKRDTFLLLNEFTQLLYVSGVSIGRPTSFSRKLGQKVLLSFEEQMQKIDYPAIIKPIPLWTGKQVITAILNNILKGCPPFTVGKSGKISEDFFKNTIVDDEIQETNNQVANEYKSMASKFDEDKMLVRTNDLLCGVIDKAQFGEYGLVHTVQELYGSDTAGVLLSVLSRLFTAYLQIHGFTCGVDDLLIMKRMDAERKEQFENCGDGDKVVHQKFIGIRDENINLDPVELQLSIEKIIRGEGEFALNFLDREMKNETNSRTTNTVMDKLLSEGLLKPSGKNCISLMTASGAKGSKVNFQQISSYLGQQELEGKRVPRMVSGKTLPSFPPWDWGARAGGFIGDRFLTGLRPQEYYFHCMAGREGLVDTAVKTSRSGYLQRCLIKNMESLAISYDHTVRDADGSIVQFQYGEDGVDVHKTSFIAKFDALAANRDIIFKQWDDHAGTSNAYISKLPLHLKDEAKRYVKSLNYMDSFNKKFSPKSMKHEDLFSLVSKKFFLSLAQPGEPVGVLAAQSVGEPSTQMTLNTFHLAGRGEMNVTLGIPRLQEILMTASSDIKTPIMTCPLIKGRKNEDADRLAEKLKKVTVADIIESMEISVVPFAIQNGLACRVYKLRMNLNVPPHYPKSANIIEDWEEILETGFVRELEDAIQNHFVLLSRISGIKNFLPESRTRTSDEADEVVTGNESHGRANDGDNYDDDNYDGDDDDQGAEDLGSDVHKRKMQAVDEMDYDDFREDQTEGESSSEESTDFESEIDNNEPETGMDEMPEDATSEYPASTSMPESAKKSVESPSKAKHSESGCRHKKKKSERKPMKRARGRLIKRDFDRAIFVQAKDMNFEIHFKFTNEPHILLAEIVKKTAKKVYIQNPGKIEQCRVTNCKEGQVIYYGDDPKRRNEISPVEKEKIPALHASGIDFNTFWELQDRLDTRYIYSNNIDAMLKTYGIEAARATIIREVNHVFKSYGISVSLRHLTLIADFMTHSGDYRPMNRLGGIAESISPLSKMSFETASKFIVEAALHGQVDNLETPSARICLGLPVKMGTGSFDLMQKLDLPKRHEI